jgi:hypothetical protein
LRSPPPAVRRSPKRPRISPPLPALVNEPFEDRPAGAGGRGGENRRWRDGPTGLEHSVSNEPRQASALATFLAARDRLEASDRTASINNQDRLAALETVD